MEMLGLRPVPRPWDILDDYVAFVNSATCFQSYLDLIKNP
jgi:hypothetical protein